MKKFILLLSVVVLVPSCLLSRNTVTESPSRPETRAPLSTLTAVPEDPPTSIPLSPTTTPPPPTQTTSLLDRLTDQLSGGFDYFILALAWEPDYCASNDDPQACAPEKKYGFILHGLWPTFVQGWPSYCSTEPMTAELRVKYPDLYPNDFLYTHEWEKHGTCTGLDPEGYLLLSRELRESVRIPEMFIAPEEPFRMDADSLVEAFVQVNPGFNKKSFAVHCSGAGGYLNELYVCFSRAGLPIPCLSEVVSNDTASCGVDDFLVREPQ